MRSVFRAATALLAGFSARRALINPLLVMLLGMAAISAARADNVTAEVTGYTDKGYGRVLLTFSEEIKAKVRVENSILIVDFGQPVTVGVDKLAARLPGYVSAIRRDPDNTAIRFALASKLKVNVMVAAEKLFIDLLSEDWVGLMPGLPTEVVDELARRAREAEHKAKMDRAGPRKAYAPVKLRYAMAPTFARFSFEMAEPVRVASEREGQELRITFDAPVKVDFGEVMAQLPAGVVGLDADYQSDSTTVKLVIAPEAELRTFQENAAFVADITLGAPQKPQDIEGLIKSMQPEAKQAAAAAKPEIAEKNQLAGKNESAGKKEPAEKNELEAVSPEEMKSMADAAPAAPAVPVDLPDAPAIAASAPTSVPVSAPAAPVKPAAASKTPDDSIFVTVVRQTGGLTITLPFNEPVAGAMFRRGDWTFIVLDTTRAVRLTELANDSSQIVKGFQQSELPGGQLIKLKIDAMRLTSLATDDKGWTIQVGSGMASPSRPIPARRVFAGQDRAGIFIPLVTPGRAYNLKDSEIGDDLVVITASSPVRGMVRGQDFVDFNALASVHGVVLAPKADDLSVELSLEGVTVTRPHGLDVSEMSSVLPPLPETTRGAENASTALDPDIWEEERRAAYEDREMELSRALAEAPIAGRAEKRLTLARFYLAHDLASNAIGVLEAGSESEERPSSDSSYALLHGYAQLSMGRAATALRDFNNPVLAKSPQASLLRASALSNLTRWTEARDQYNSGKNAVATLPLKVQRAVLMDALRAMIAANDFAAASDIRGELDVVGVPDGMKSAVKLLSGRLMAGLGRSDQAANIYAELAAGPESPAMSEARLRLVEMRMKGGDFDRARAIEALETLSFVWRGDETEVETMRLLAKLYVAEVRYRDAFNLLDAALLVQPESGVTRSFYNEMATIFEDLFLSERASAIEPVESLAIYYDFSKLTPIGRRGDEMIRRLADRLVSVDLLDQAAELLDYQVKYRLTGIAKAQVAAKLAWVQLLNHKPAPAIQALADTRIADLPNDLREQRLMLEARALSELGRYDAAIELAAGVSGAEAERLRGDILWGAKRWREAGEAYEKLLGPRWQRAEPLNEMERADVLRAGIAFTFGNETIGLARLRDRYAAKMPESEERTALGVITGAGGDAKKISNVAKALSAMDSLRLFLKLYQARFPDKPLPEAEANAAPQKISAR